MSGKVQLRACENGSRERQTYSSAAIRMGAERETDLQQCSYKNGSRERQTYSSAAIRMGADRDRLTAV